MEDSNCTVQNCSLYHFMAIHRQDVSYQHVFEVLSFPCGFAHRENGSGRCYGIGDSNKCFLRDMATFGAGESEDARADKGERQAKPISSLAVWIHSNQNGDSGTQGSNLCQSQIHKNHTTLD